MNLPIQRTLSTTAEEILLGKFQLTQFFFIALTLGIVGKASVSSRYEAEISEIQLAYHTRDYARGITLADNLLREAPSLPEAMEIKALLLSAKNDRSAIAQYDKLIELRKKEGKAKDVAQYEMLAGRMAYRFKDVPNAAARLNRAAKEPSVAGAANYYLGLIARDQGRYDDARSYFGSALDSNNEDIKPVAQLQLSHLDAQNRNGDSAVRGLVRARTLANERLKWGGSSAAAKDLANQVQKATGKELHSLEESALLVNAGLMSGYDSNVLSVPSGTTTGSSTPSASSFVETLNYGIIYATSPGDEFQFVPSYRGSFNYNLNADTRNAQFLLNDFRLNITRNALESTSYGFKLGAIVGFQYQVDPATNNGRLGAYSLQGSLGPYLKTALNNDWTLTTELFFQPKKMYLDDSFSATLRESGLEQYLKATVATSKMTAYWNPGISLSGIWTQTTGEEFRGRRVALDFGNTFNFSPNLIAGLSTGLTATWYPDRLNGIRRDQCVNIVASGGYRLTDEFNVLASLSYVSNFSNVSAYRFNRMVAAIGGNYAF